jgi:cytochrome P450
LSWSIYLLSQDERARARIEQEVDDVLGDGPLEAHHLDRLVYTRAVIDEAIRLYPPAPFLGRAAIHDEWIGDLHIPAGSMVAISTYVLHRHRTLWDQPDMFRPERFLPEERGRIDRFAYLPFGAGPRVCIGASFALQEAVIVLASIVRAVRLDLKEGHEVAPLHRITLRPREGLPMRLTHRSSAKRQAAS